MMRKRSEKVAIAFKLKAKKAHPYTKSVKESYNQEVGPSPLTVSVKMWEPEAKKASLCTIFIKESCDEGLDSSPSTVSVKSSLSKIDNTVPSPNMVNHAEYNLLIVAF